MIFNWFTKRMEKINAKIKEQEDKAEVSRKRLAENNLTRPVSNTSKPKPSISSPNRSRTRPVRSEDYAPYNGFNDTASGGLYSSSYDSSSSSSSSCSDSSSSSYSSSDSGSSCSGGSFD